MKNEVQRFRISFANLPVGNKGANLNEYTRKNSQGIILTCVQLEESGQLAWEMINIGPSNCFYSKSLYGYKAGAAYEAEIGTRLVYGKHMLAEDYIASLRAAPIYNIEDLANCKLTSTVRVRPDDLARMKNDEFYGTSIDEEVCSIVEEGNLLKIDIPLVDLNHIAVADNAPWSGVDKTIAMVFHSPQTMPSPIKGPLMGETVDMF